MSDPVDPSSQPPDALVNDLISGTDEGARVCEYRDDMSPGACFELLRTSLNDYHLVFHPYEGAGVVPEQLLREGSTGKETLARGFHRLIVLDVRQAVDAGGLFDLAGFYVYALRQFCRAFGIAEPEAYHEEDLFQILRDEPKSLLCLVNVHLISSDNRRRLRSLTQEKHQALIVYQRGPFAAASEAYLQVLRGVTPGSVFALKAGRNVVGRHPECDVVLDVGAVSRQHAVINFEAGQYFIEDLRSRNGTFVNGEPVSGRRRLFTNDRIKICDCVLAFQRKSGGVPDSRQDDFDDRGTWTETVDDFDDRGSFQEDLPRSSESDAKLRAVREITQRLASASGTDAVLQELLAGLFQTFVQADRAFVVLKDPTTGALVPKAVKNRPGDDGESIRISRTIVNQAMDRREAILSADAAGTSRLDGSQSIADFRIRSIMCAPLITGGHVLGVVQIDTLDQRARFQASDLDVLATIAVQAASVVENAQLQEADLRRHALERDLDLARHVQAAFLPSAAPKVAGYRIFDSYEAVGQVSGDFYDYVPLADGRIAVVLSDVAGRGVPAVLLGAKIGPELRYQLAVSADPAEALGRVNAALVSPQWEDRFATLLLVVLDSIRHEATILNAGHMSPFLRRAKGRIDAVGRDNSGLPLGIDVSWTYDPTIVPMNSGDVLVLFNDGIVEAMDSENQQYGLERLRGQIERHGGADVTTLGRAILDDIAVFRGSRPQNDGQCLICIRRD